ncbi:MAG: M6 family metalloprotease domain-containing protein, partial [Kiritimatiellaeota bacterium]|nr:M6 family metalloprotease domain-containing protein [Kiritimatiellota bacterium]
MKNVLTMVLLSCAAWQCGGAPACPEPFEEEHPEGGTRRFHLRGDEFFSWVEDEDGAVYARDPNHRLAYAEISEGRLAPRRAGQRHTVRGKEAAALAAEAPQPPAFAPMSAPTLSPRKLLVVVAGFEDIAPTSTAAFWEERFFGATGKTVRTYYEAVSKGRFYFEPAAGNGVVMVTLPTTAHPNPPDNGKANADTRAAAAALLAAAAAQVDFAAFDTDGNGVIEPGELSLVFILAGGEGSAGGSPTPRVWAHHTSFSPAPTAGGKTVSCGYAMMGERHAAGFATIGTPCHELGHGLGLYDLYDTTEATYGIGAHGLMGTGCWGRAGSEPSGATPVFLCAFHRCRLGFSEALEIASGAHAHALAAASSATPSDTDALKIATVFPGEYFLVENRQPTGFDQGLQRYFGAGATDGGLAVWHVDESRYGPGANNNPAKKAVALEEANGLSQLDDKTSQGSRQHYFYAGHADRFDASTNPASRNNDGSPSGIFVSNIGASAAYMYLNVVVMRPAAPPANLTATTTLADRVRLAWDHAPLATEYEIYRR